MAFFGATLLLRCAITSLYGVKPGVVKCMRGASSLLHTATHTVRGLGQRQGNTRPLHPPSNMSVSTSTDVHTNLSDAEKLGDMEHPTAGHSPATHSDHHLHVETDLHNIWPLDTHSSQSLDVSGYLTDDDKALIAVIGQVQYEEAMAAGHVGSVYSLLEEAAGRDTPSRTTATL